MRAFELILALLGGPWPVQAAETPKQALREHLCGELAAPRLARFDAPPLLAFRSTCDLAGTLIEILEEAAPDTKGVEEGRSALSVLDQYWRQFPDARIPLAMKKTALDPGRPFDLRHDAASRRGKIPAAETPAFYADILKGHPDLAGPLVAWLRATPSGLDKWMSIRELYTPELREALRVYVDGRLAIPSLLPEDRRMYAGLVAELDRASGRPPDGHAPKATPPEKSNPSTSPMPDPDVVQVPGKKPVPGTSGRTLAFGAFAALLSALLLFRILRRR